ncbi:MAG: ATP-binding protein, partial [Specibacter sp.]
GGPLTGARLMADERITNFVKGLSHLDARLGSLVLELPAPAALPPSQEATAQQITALVEASLPVISLPGPHRKAKELIAAKVAAVFGLRLFALPAADLPAAAESAELARLWHRETVLSGVGLFLDAQGIDPAEPGADTVRRWVAQSGGLTFVAVREPWTLPAAVNVDTAKPAAQEQRRAWESALGAGSGKKAALLAGRFDLDLDDIAASVGRAGAGGDVWAAALETARPALDQLAQRVDSKAALSDLKLPALQAEQLRRIAGQVRRRSTVLDDFGFAGRLNRGTGLGVLFAGESGTGKTMAAEALARDLDMMLYRIDLSAVVSKYIGETEKNLRKLFDAAEGGGAVLFFDEADALFGKRSEVRDSHDRYANIEVSYLLQRMESFRGLAILATNRRDSLDAAFLRRLRFVVTFPFPATAERRAIWSAVFPAATPVDGLSTERLARLNLTGGSIHNVALNAAYLAANDGGTVTMELLLAAARDEFRKLDRPVNDADFAWSAGEGRHGH